MFAGSEAALRNSESRQNESCPRDETPPQDEPPLRDEFPPEARDASKVEEQKHFKPASREDLKPSVTFGSHHAHSPRLDCMGGDVCGHNVKVVGEWGMCFVSSLGQMVRSYFHFPELLSHSKTPPAPTMLALRFRLPASGRNHKMTIRAEHTKILKNKSDSKTGCYLRSVAARYVDYLAGILVARPKSEKEVDHKKGCW